MELGLVALSGAPLAGQLSEGPPPDTRRDWYEIPMGDDDLLLWAGADIFKTSTDRLTDNGDGTHELETRFWVDATGAPCPCAGCPPCPECPPCPVCPEGRFRGQQSAGGSTGILVGRNLVMTPLHTIGNLETCLGTSFVFDHFQLASNEPPVNPNGGPSSITIPNERIYRCTGWTPVPDYDMVVVTLDRPVTGRLPVKLNRHADIEAGTGVVLFGHPAGLPMKVEDGVTTRDLFASSSLNFRAQVHSVGGASGSMLLERASGKLIGMGTTVINWWDCGPTCCADNPNWHDEPMGLQNAAAAASLIPPVGLQVDPGVRVVESFGPPRGAFTNTSTEYAVWLPLGEPSAIPQSLSLEGVSVYLFLLAVGTAGILGPGQSATFRVVLQELRTYPIGVFESVVRVEDPVYRTRDIRIHRLRSGLDGFEVAPVEPFVGDGPGAFPEDEKLYTLFNLYEESPLVVEARADQPWIRFNGQAGPTNVFLAPGSPADLVIGFDVDYLPNGVYSATVELEQTPYNGQPASLDVQLDIGREVFKNDVPVTIGPSGAVMAIVTPSGGFYQDVDVALDITLERALGTVPVVELASPLNAGVRTILRLWEGGEIGGGPLVGGFTPSAFELDTVYDDTTHPAAENLAPLSLTNYDGGGWELRVFERDGKPLAGGEITRAAVRVTAVGL